MQLSQQISTHPLRSHSEASTSARPLPCSSALPASTSGSLSRRSPHSLRSKLSSSRRVNTVCSSSTADVVSSVVSSGLICAIGWQLLHEPEVSGRSPTEESDQMGSRQSCMRCNGMGYEPCFCSKWSDGDVGCSACSKSGYMRCRSCGGGGTLIPAYQPIKVQAKQDP